MKKVLSILLAVALLVSLPVTSLASSDESKVTGSVMQLEQAAERYGITPEEVENFEDNLSVAFTRLNTIQSKTGGIGMDESVTVPVSDNLELTVSMRQERSPTRASYYLTYSTQVELTNIFGGVVVRLISYGTFLTNGSTSTPQDAYGTYDTFLWNVTNSSSAKGSAAYNSWVRNSFSGEFDLGIDPLSVTVQTFSHAGTIYCDATGYATAYWS